jgi:hypothetical protein
MPEHELASQKKQYKVDRAQHSSAQSPRPLSQELMAWDISSYLLGDNPSNPPIQRHAAMLSAAPSDDIRATIARQL